VHDRVALLRHLRLAGDGLLVTLLAVNVLLAALPVAFVVATSVLVGQVPAAVAGGAGSPGWDALVRTFLLACGAFAGQVLLTPVQTMLGELMTLRIDGWMQEQLIGTSLRSTGIAPLEDPEALDALDEVGRYFSERMHTPGSACAGMLALVARYGRLLGFVVLVGTVASWPAAVALGVAVMVFRQGQRGGLRVFARIYSTDVGAANRRATYLRAVASGPQHAKELRVFGLAGWFADRYVAVSVDAAARVSAERRRVFFRPYLAYSAFGLVVTAWVYATTGTAAARGEIGLTGLALVLQATTAAVLLGAQYPEADLQTSLGIRTLSRLTAFAEAVDEAERRAPVTVRGNAGIDTMAGRPRETLRLEGVGFAYPASDRLVLDGLDLALPAGRCTAVVGVNGAGKTTLVKLLTRLYEPTDGRITCDGTDLRDVPPDVWRRQVSVVFQDFVRYELSAADNIAFGAVHAPRNDDAVREAARRAGVLDALAELPDGLDTVLSRNYEGGTDLSGGQWQRVAIARSLYAVHHGATVLILDEPTSALDVRGEAEFFDAFVELTRGVTSVLISHRFSSVRRADAIVVVDGGRVVERGTHEELMAVDGHYRRLFRLQAERFAAGLDAEGEIDEAKFAGGEPR
jgi:ATP-binding cassette, subfamily B, bacterial